MIYEVQLRDGFSYVDAAGRTVNALGLRASDGWLFTVREQGVSAQLSSKPLEGTVVFPFSAVKRFYERQDRPVPTEAESVLTPGKKGGKK